MRAIALAIAALAIVSSATAQDDSLETEAVRSLRLPSGCSDVVTTASTGGGIVVSIHRHDGERLVPPHRGVGRVAVRVCSGRDEDVVVYVRCDQPSFVGLSATTARDGAPLVDEGAVGRDRRNTGVPFVASASARVAAAIERFVAEGLVARDPVSVQVVRTASEIAIPVRSGPGCLFLVVAAEGGDVDVAGTPVRDGRRAELLACADSGSTVAIRALAGTPRLAHAFVGAGIDPSQPATSRQVAWAESRGFSLVRELDLVLDPREDVSIPWTVGASRCAAVLVASAGPVTVTLSGEDGILLGASTTGAPGPGVVRCAPSTPLTLRVTVRAMSAGDRVRLLMVESVAP